MKQSPRFPTLQKIGNTNPIIQALPAMLKHLSLGLGRPKSITLLFSQLYLSHNLLNNFYFEDIGKALEMLIVGLPHLGEQEHGDLIALYH